MSVTPIAEPSTTITKRQEVLRAAVVGCGAIADYLHFPAIALVPELKVQAAVDIDPARAMSMAAKYGVPNSGADLTALAGQIDAAIITVPPHVKLPIIQQAFELGLHVLCEKPLANTVAECEQLIEWSRRAGKHLVAMHQFRFWPNRRWVKDRLARGELQLPNRVEVSQGAPYSWQSVTGYTVRQELVSGGVLLNAGTHPLDTLLTWFGDPIQVDYWDDSLGALESNARIRMEFPGGVVVHFRQSRTCLLSNEIRLFGDDYQIAMNNSDPFCLWKRSATGAEQICLGNPSGGFLFPAAEVYRNFVMAVQNDRLPEVDAVEATRVIRLVETCYQQKRCRSVPANAPIPGMTW